MKKTILLVFISVIAFACGNQESGKEKTSEAESENNAAPAEPATPAVQDVTANPDYQKGLELIAGSDCLTCHAVEEKKIGPSYRDVANKYANDQQTIDLLAGKIIKGGSGVWGQVPMTPHPQISTEDAKQMVKYILLLKK
ncbi:MAG: c-type cytochrome [Chitinophagaceae bacterium]